MAGLAAEIRQVSVALAPASAPWTPPAVIKVCVFAVHQKMFMRFQHGWLRYSVVVSSKFRVLLYCT
jgi:hypothetical protein